MQAGPWECGAEWNQCLPSPPAQAGPCLAAAYLFFKHLGPAFSREHVPSLAGTLHCLGVAQAMPFIAEEWKIFSVFPAQLLVGLVSGFPPVFPGCAPHEGVPLSPVPPVMSPGPTCPRVLPVLQEQENNADAADLSVLSRFLFPNNDAPNSPNPTLWAVCIS